MRDLGIRLEDHIEENRFARRETPDFLGVNSAPGILYNFFINIFLASMSCDFILNYAFSFSFSFFEIKDIKRNRETATIGDFE